MIFVIERGHDERTVLGLTLDEFYSRYHSCERLQAVEILIAANMNRAAQSSNEEFKGWTKFWKKRLKQGIPNKTDLDEFLSDFGTAV